MQIRSLALALAVFGAAVPLAAQAAINIHFEIVNQRGETVTVEPAPCAGFGKTHLEAGKSLAVDCKIEVGGQTALQVRTVNGVGVICWPHAVAMTEYRIEASNLGTSSCSFDRLGGTSYRMVLVGAKYFTIHLKNQRDHDIKVTMTNSNCTGNIGWNEHSIPKGGGIDFRCFREDFARGQGVTIQARVPNNTRDMICQAWWHENKTHLFYGNCAINQVGPDDYDLLIR
ncbi:MAG TPA: hypothetical protein VNF68_13700 [Candidatus Baltobacteraceae bacterium]|nr:hypothetical protein [Candidatus Baltobacteraceae bacterium]